MGNFFKKNCTHKILSDVCLNYTPVDQLFEENDFDGLEKLDRVNVLKKCENWFKMETKDFNFLRMLCVS